MNTAEYFIKLRGHVYQHNKKYLITGLSKPAKLKNSRYFLNTPPMFTLFNYAKYEHMVEIFALFKVSFSNAKIV